MPRVSPAVSGFTSGEWSPQMFGQIDLAAYPNACRYMRNFVCRVHGGAQKRPGTIFVAEVKDSTQKVRLIPFQFSTTQAYIIETGAAYMRFYKDRGRLEISNIPYEISTCYAENDAELVKYAQDKDLMYLFHRGYKPQQLTRFGHTDWEIADFVLKNGPYLATNQSEEVGTNLITNGDMEDDSNWTAVGSPLYSGRSDDQKYKDTYSWEIRDDAADKGAKSDVFATVTNTVYLHRFRIYTAAGTMKIKIHQGSDSGTWLYEETITDIPVNEWAEYERSVKETAGGSGAYIEFLTALTASVTGYESDYPPAQSGTYVKSTTKRNTNYWPYYVTDPAKGLTGSANKESWLAEAYVVTNQRFHIDLGEDKLINRIYYENWKDNELNRQTGVRHFTFWGSNSPTAFEDLVYSHDTDWTEITLAANEFDIHSPADLPDPKYILVTATNKYRYYAFKFADNWGATESMGIRRIELQEAEYENDPRIYIDDAECFKTNTVTMTPAAKTGNGIKLTASDSYFESGHIGAFFQLTHTTTVGYAKVVSIPSPTMAVVNIIIDFGDTTATTVWREGAWSIKNGFPACGCFYEQRLIGGSTDEDPDGIWGSKQTEYDDFTPGTNDADPISYKLQSDIVRWLAPMGQLVVGTVNSEYRLGAQSSNESLTPTNIKITQQSRKGSADLDPVSLGNSILFVQRRGKATNYGTKVRELSYDYVRDAFAGVDLTLFAEHITGTGIKRCAFMSSPFPIMWAVTNDGYLIGMTYEREQNVIGWHYHPTDGLVEDICIIPGANQDDLYLIVNRTIDGVAKKYIEVMADFDWGADLEDAFFVDCGLTYDGASTSTITGLDHLEGEEVAILADGIKVARKTVASGSITLDAAASVVQVGLPYTSKLQPLDLQGGSEEGVSQGKTKRIHKLALYFYNSFGGKIGSDANNTERIFLKEETTNGTTTAPTLFSGLKNDFNFRGNWQLEGQVYIEHDDPLPFTVLSILPSFRSEDK